MHKVLYRHKFIWIIILLISFVAVSLYGQDKAYPLLHEVSRSDKAHTVIQDRKPLVPCLPAEGTQLERLMYIIRRQSLSDQKPGRSELIFSLWTIMRIICLAVLVLSVSCKWKRESFDQHRRALIRYIHHKEDQQ